MNTASSSHMPMASAKPVPYVKPHQSGGKKSNGHKSACKCPICKNMMKHKKGKKGGADDDESWDIEMGPKPESDVSAEPVKEGDYDSYDAAEKGEAGPNVVGGTRKRKGRKSRKSRKGKKSHKKTHHRRHRSSKK